MIKSVPGRLAPAIATVMVLLAGCASGPPEDVTLKGRMEAVATVNPDGQGRPSPLVIKIYQLKAKDKFELAEFFPLFDQPEATLGADMLAVEDLMMVPGEVRPFEGEFDPQTRFIGVIASFRNINQAQWRSVVPMPERNVTKFLKRGGLNIKAESLSITVSIDD